MEPRYEILLAIATTLPKKVLNLFLRWLLLMFPLLNDEFTTRKKQY
jgi:hypothetical protein